MTTFPLLTTASSLFSVSSSFSFSSSSSTTSSSSSYSFSSSPTSFLSYSSTALLSEPGNILPSPARTSLVLCLFYLFFFLLFFLFLFNYVLFFFLLLLLLSSSSPTSFLSYTSTALLSEPGNILPSPAPTSLLLCLFYLHFTPRLSSLQSHATLGQRSASLLTPTNLVNSTIYLNTATFPSLRLAIDV